VDLGDGAVREGKAERRQAVNARDFRITKFFKILKPVKEALHLK